MGNCLAGLAFKPDGMEEEPRYEIYRPRPRAIIQRETYSRTISDSTEDITSSGSQSAEINKLFEEGMRGFGDIFEPLPTVVTTNEREGSTSKSIELSVQVGPIESEEVKNATKEGILYAMTELERELNRRKDWISQPIVNEKAGESDAPKEDQASEVPKEEQEKPKPKVFKNRVFFKKPPRAIKRRVSFKNPAKSNDKAPNSVELEQQSSPDLEVPPPQKANKKVPERRIRIAKRAPSLHLVRPHHRFKNNVHKRSQAPNIKKQNFCARVKVKAD